VRVALDISFEQPAERYEPVMGLLSNRVGRSFSKSGRPAVRWVATDHDWSSGDGPRVEGVMADLALTAAGRHARLDALDGDGVAALRDWHR